jgi:transcriptional regulator with XRE-family HTH domain
MFSAARFEVARKRRGLTKSELAGRIGVDLRAVTAYERGEYEPSVDTLTQIAGVLDFPIGWFSGGDLHQPSPQTASFRSQARMAAGHRDAALASGALAFLLNDWLESRFTLPVPGLPDLREEEPEAAAITLRQHWGLENDPLKTSCIFWNRKASRFFRWRKIQQRLTHFLSGGKRRPLFF